MYSAVIHLNGWDVIKHFKSLQEAMDFCTGYNTYSRIVNIRTLEAIDIKKGEKRND